MATAMIRSKSKKAFLAAGALCAAAFIVWPGCATAPLPASRTPLSALKRADFSFEKDPRPTQDDVLTKIGPADEYFPDLHVACYKLNQVKRRRLVLMFFVLPIAWPKEPTSLEVAFVQYDDHDRVQRTDIKIVPAFSANQSAMHNEAKSWLAQPRVVPHDYSHRH
jgi:hypothetical protein